MNATTYISGNPNHSAMWLATVLLAAAIASPAALAESFLQPHIAEYKVKVSLLGGRLKTELLETDDGYVATHVIRPTGLSRILARGLISDRSEFTITENGVRPTRFVSRDTITKKKGTTAVDFDWDIGEAHAVVNGVEMMSAIDGLAQDRISLQYELMFDLLRGAASDEYVLYDVDKLKTLAIRNIGSKVVKVPAGKFTAIGIQHQAARSRRVTTMWCVKELGYLPVIIEQHRKGKLRLRATLRNYEPISS